MAELNPTQEQQPAIDFPGNMVVVASPGSGKTTVLSLKIRRLLPDVPAFQGIIAISHTNKASDELERRSKSQAFDIKRSFFGTIDDFCLREIIRPFARHLMLMAADCKTVKNGELPDAVKHLLPSTPSIQQATITDLPQFLPFLQEALAQGYIPLAAVGMLAFHVTNQSSACQRYLKARYRAVFIDEYQDSGFFQHQIFLKLKELSLIAVAVGDADQSIYAFAHKHPQYLQALSDQESGFSTFPITVNFRSHSSISDFASRLINPQHSMVPTSDLRVFLKKVTGDQADIGAWLTTAIPTLMTQFKLTAMDRIAILCRSENSGHLIGDHLGLPNHVFERTAFDDEASNEAGVFKDLLQLRFNQELTAETLINQKGLLGMTMAAKRALRQAIQLCRSCPEPTLADTVLDATTRLLGHSPSQDDEQLLRDACSDSEKLRAFHAPAPGVVQILTLHKAKGLEFDVVFHADLYDHIIPKQNYPSGPHGPIFENEQQCLNLHYVGITRAIHGCVLLTSTSRVNGQGQRKRGAPSQFLFRNGTNPTPISW